MRSSHPTAVALAAAIVVSAASLAALPGAAHAAPAPTIKGAACQPGQGVTVAVDFSGIPTAKDAAHQGVVDVRCAPGAAGTIADAFQAAGFTFDSDSYLTTVDGEVADYSVDQSYWTVFTSAASGTTTGTAGSDWTAGMVGVGAGPVSTDQAYLVSYNFGGAWPFTAPVTLAEVTGIAGDTVVKPPANTNKDAKAGDAAAWLGRQLAANNDVLPYQGSTDWGLTIDALLALASAGVGGDQIQATADKLWASGEAYAGKAGDTTKWSAQAKLALALLVAGKDPTKFPAGAGTRNLIAELRGALTASGAFGGTSTIAYTQAIAVITLARTTAGVPVQAVDWLKAQQCTAAGDKNLGAYGWTAGCSSTDSDATALVVQALLAAGVPATDPAVADAKAWLLAQQDAAGGVASSFVGPNTNSTGLFAQTLRALGGADSAVTQAEAFIGGLQVGCDAVNADDEIAIGDLGAIALETVGLDDAKADGVDFSLDQWLRATTNAILGLGGPAFDKLTAEGAAAALPAGTCEEEGSGEEVTTTSSSSAVATKATALPNSGTELGSGLAGLAVVVGVALAGLAASARAGRRRSEGRVA